MEAQAHAIPAARSNLMKIDVVQVDLQRSPAGSGMVRITVHMDLPLSETFDLLKKAAEIGRADREKSPQKRG
jgi:hypothetical protein